MAGIVTTITGDSGTVLLEGVRYGGRSNTGVVKTEDVTYKNKVTSNPVETGSSVNDHVFIENNGFSITATVIDGTLRDILMNMRDNRDLLKYRGIESFDDIVITSLKMTPSAQNETGFELAMSFQKIEFVTAQKVKINKSMAKADEAVKKASPAAKSQTKPTSNKGTQTAEKSSVSAQDYVSTIDKKMKAKLEGR